MNGWKFLDPTGCTYYQSEAFVYNLPQRGERWGLWTVHPNPAAADGLACGPGRLHLMKSLNAMYAPENWWPWFAQGDKLTGQDEEKASFVAVRLRRVAPRVLARCLRPPFNWGRGADLSGANLRWANLRGADLSKADLHEADLRGADLREAVITNEQLHSAFRMRR